MLMQRFHLVTPSRFIAEARGVLAVATDAIRQPDERDRATRLLRELYEPLLARRAEAPEGFAKAWAEESGRAARAIAEYLVTETSR